jgi:ABC-2 type transport system ATP-binding protein/lipopolysaccharide transport system ATP-binding protein
MYVRLGFAIAVAVRPEILVIDEVIAVGDEQFQRKCFDHLHTLRQSGATIVLVSHSLATIENMCDEAVWIDHGEVRMDGKANEVVKGYIESVNEVESRVDQESGLVHVGSGEALIRNVTLRGSHPQAPVTAGGGFEAVISFESSCDLEDVIIGLGFRHESGARLAEPNSLDSGLVRLVKGPGEVRFASESLILNPGRYSVTAAIVQTGHFVDLVNEQFDLVVQPSGGNEHGLVRMEGSWEVVQG